MSSVNHHPTQRGAKRVCRIYDKVAQLKYSNYLQYQA